MRIWSAEWKFVQSYFVSSVAEQRQNKGAFFSWADEDLESFDLENLQRRISQKIVIILLTA